MPALSPVLLTFSFKFSMLFFNILLTRPHPSHIYGSGPHQHTIRQYWTMDVAENLGKSLSGMQCTVQEKDFEVIITVKMEMETRHPVGRRFSREFFARDRTNRPLLFRDRISNCTNLFRVPTGTESNQTTRRSALATADHPRYRLPWHSGSGQRVAHRHGDK